MSKSYPYSGIDDNAGRCESCNRPETEYQTQTGWPVELPAYGGGKVMGTMWLCPACLEEKRARDEARKYDGCAL